MTWAKGLATPAIGVFSACCSRTPAPPSDCTSARVLRYDSLVLGRVATGASLSFDHSDNAALCVRVVWSPPSEIPPSLRGAAPAVFLFFWAGSSAAALFPQTSPDIEGGLSVQPLSVPLDSNEALMAPSSG